MHLNKYLAEAIGTFVLALAVGLSLAKGFPVPTPVVAGLTLAMGVYTLGGISGAHFNPAVTLALWSIKKISSVEGLFYIVAQLAGAGLAILGRAILVDPDSIVTAQNTVHAAATEALGAFLLVWGVSAVVHGKVHQAAAGLTIGSSLLLGILLASVGSNGVLNPAVALGIGSLNLAYVLGPITGAVVAAWGYRALSAKD